MRDAYNSVLLKDATPVPPFDEWTTDGLCEHIFCRYDHWKNKWWPKGVTNEISMTIYGLRVCKKYVLMVKDAGYGIVCSPYSVLPERLRLQEDVARASRITTVVTLSSTSS